MSERYQVRTRDWWTGRCTPQRGLPPGPFTKFGLRAVLRQLRAMGYDVARGGPSVLVERVDAKLFVEAE